MENKQFRDSNFLYERYVQDLMSFLTSLIIPELMEKPMSGAEFSQKWEEYSSSKDYCNNDLFRKQQKFSLLRILLANNGYSLSVNRRRGDTWYSCVKVKESP